MSTVFSSLSVSLDGFIAFPRRFMVGRGLCDVTHGWDAKPPANAPMVVVTHEAPTDSPTGGVAVRIDRVER